jgi:hypothetical protein
VIGLRNLQVLSNDKVAELCAVFNGRPFTMKELRTAARAKHGQGAYPARGLKKLVAWGYLSWDLRANTYRMISAYEPNVTHVTFED